MTHDTLKIGLTFSGGGYRAATFHLGVLTYLDSLPVGDHTLLHHVTALSTISGGTITGLRYMLGLARGESVGKIYHDLYDFITTTDLVTGGLGRLSDPKTGCCRSLIKAMSGIYNQYLFDGATFGDLMEAREKIPVRHFSANATDFVNGLQFRFQLSEKILHPRRGEPLCGIIGNQLLPLDPETAREIHLSDILASSSCFPSGFEPIMFPDDFSWKNRETEEKVRKQVASFGLMDGGIVDNQGIEPILLANERMKRNDPDDSLHLIIVSDVSSPFMDKYEPCSAPFTGTLGNLTFRKLFTFLNFLWGITTWAALIAFFRAPGSFPAGFLTALWLSVSGLLIGTVIAKKKVAKLVKESVAGNCLPLLDTLKFGDVATLVANRGKSVVQLASSVFMKHIRRLNYRAVFRNDAWKYRRVMNAIYQLCTFKPTGADFPAKNGYPAYLQPGRPIVENTKRAANMGTTLWFTEKEKEERLPETVIACGQYTICWNLLTFLYRLKDSPLKNEACYAPLLALEERLKADWMRFQENPFCRLPDKSGR